MNSSDTDSPAKRSVPSFKPIVPAPYSHSHTAIRSASILPSLSSPLTPDPSPTMTPDNPKLESSRDSSGSASLAATSTAREYSASIVGQSPSFKATGGQQLPTISDLNKTTATSSPRPVHHHPPSGTPPMSPGLALVSPVPRPHCGITDPSQYSSSSSGFYQLPPPLQPFSSRQSPHQSPAMRPQSSQSHSLPPLPPLPSPSVHANGYSPRSTPQMSPLPNLFMVSPAIGPLSPYPTPQHQPRQYSSPHMDPLAPKQSIPAMALPASVLSSSSASHEVTSRSYSTILPRRDSEQRSPTSVPVSDRSAPSSPRRFSMLPPPSTPIAATTSSSSSSKAVAATPSTLLSLKPSRSQTRKGSVSGCGSGSTTATTRRRASSSAKLVDQETRDLMRKVSHSAIERRRRERINDKILQLKHLVPACVDEDHLHKLSILQSTIEYIQHLKSILPASVVNIKVGRATNNNPNNKTTDMLDAMGGSISAKSPLTPLMTTGLNHFHAKRIKVDKPEIRALLEEHSPGFTSSSSDEDAKDGLLLLAGQSAESTTESSRHDHKRALRKKRSIE